MNTRFLTLAFLLLAFKTAKAQDLPTVIPPSPRAESFHIYGDIAVSHNTGVPDISIPLYTIESDGITVPIVLRYHIGSVKPGKDNSNIAFGWTLDVGGRISRTINHMPDEYYPRPTTFKLRADLDPLVVNDLLYLRYAYEDNTFDTKYDIFSYSAIGDYSKFIVHNQTGSLSSVHELLKSSKKIDFSTVIDSNFSSTIETIDVFKSVNGLGQTYYFGENDAIDIVNISGSPFGSAPSSWLLTKIVSADKSNNVNFTYTPVPLHEYPLMNFYEGRSPQDGETPLGQSAPNTGSGNGTCSTEMNFGSNMSYEINTIQEITFKEGKVIFNLSPDKKRINSLEIRNNNNDLIKSVDFVRSFYPNQSVFERLESIEINDNNDSPVKVYQFEYFDYGMPRADQTDFWGYYNGIDNSVFSREILNIPNNSIQLFPVTCTSGYSNRNASELYTKSYTLNKITYPTGGTTEFEFEPNQYTEYSQTLQSMQTINGSGLRVERITNIAKDGSSGIIKTYDYTPRALGDKSPFNSLNYTTTSYYAMQPGGANSLWKRYRSRIISHSFNAEIIDTHVNYEVVTEYQGFSSTNIGKTIYTYEYELENTYNSISVVNSSYNFGALSAGAGLGSNRLIEYHDGGNGKIKQIEYFKNIGGVYTSIKKINNTYSYALYSTSYNFNIVPLCSYGTGDSHADLLFRNEQVLLGRWDDADALPLFGMYDSYIRHNSDYLIKQEVTETPDSGTEITTTTEYAYNDKGLVTEQTIHDSKGNTQIVKTLYPDDIDTVSTLENGSPIVGGSLTSTAFSAVDAMKEDALHRRIATPIQTETYKDDGTTETLLSVQRTNFKVWDLDNDSAVNDPDDAILPEAVKTSKGTNVLEDRVEFLNYYDNGNIQEVLKTDGTHIVYIWGYNETYPIAKIENATYSQVSGYVTNIQNKSDLDDDRCLDSGTCDEKNLRTALADLRNISGAMVTTYTYDPLVGITSVTDPKGYTMYYEYDDFNRLQQVKDADGKILSQTEYHYKGQQ